MLKNDIKEIILKNILVKKETKDNFYFTNNDGSWIFDFRRGFLSGEILEKFCIFFWDKYESEFPFQVGGLELGAVPFISGIIYEGKKRGYNVNSFIVRKQRKLSGLGNQIEGFLNSEKIIVVDDLVNTGSSLFFVSDVLKNQENKLVYKFFVFVNFGREKLNSYFRDSFELLDYEFTLSDFGLSDYMDNKNETDYPIIFPGNKRLFSLKNSNKFLEAPKSNPLKIGKNIIFGGEGATLVSICSDTGNLNYEYKINPVVGHKNILSSPVYLGNNLFFGGYDGNLHCINLLNGELKWKFYDAEWIGSSPCISEKLRSIYVGLEHGGTTNKGSLASIDLFSGNLNWQILFDDYVHCSPEINEKYSLVLCGSNDGKLVCARGDNGKILYERFFNAPIKGGFTFSDDFNYAFFGCFDGYIYGIDVLYGNILFKYKTDDIVYAKPFLYGENLFFGSLDKYFYHYDLKKSVLVSKIRTTGKIFSQAILISKSIVAFGSNDSNIYFYDFTTGKICFIIKHKERISTKLIFDKESGCLYVSDFLNNMYKYDVKKFIK